MSNNGKENRREIKDLLIKIDETNLSCGFEEVGGRPKECPNNPLRFPDNHRPKICQQCPGDPDIWQVARSPLSPVHIKTKQGGEIIFPKPKKP